MGRLKSRKIDLETKLNERQKAYVEKRVKEGKTKGEAYKEAYKYPAISGHEAWKRGDRVEKSENVQAYLAKLKETVKIRIIEEADESLNRILLLASQAESERVKLDANKYLLQVAGFKESVQLNALNIFNLMSPQELAKVIRQTMLDAAQKHREQEDVIDVEVKE